MKKIRNFSLVVFYLLLSVAVFGQQDSSNLSNTFNKNTLDLSIGGGGLFISANYSRVIIVKPNYYINSSVGIGTVPIIGGITIPHQLTFNLGKKSSFLELGVGGTFWTGKSNESGYTEAINSYNIYPIIGWRKNFNNNLVFRAYVNPLIHISGVYLLEDYKVIPYLGLSLGYSF